jgi:anti-sigma regulatory factor (Ser/Thr protein kinase)
VGRRDGTFRHEAFVFSADEEFVARVTAFAREGLDGGEAVVIAEPPDRLEQVRDALADDADEVVFVDLGEVGGNPGRLIALWQRCLDGHVLDRPLRGVGQPLWPGRAAAEVLECEMHEILLNRTFGNGPGWRLLCPYDATYDDPALAASLAQAHPSGVLGNLGAGAAAEAAQHERRLAELFATPLDPPPDGAVSMPYSAHDVALVRNVVRRFAAACGLAPERCDELALCGSEAATNSVRYGGGSGRLSMWCGEDCVMLQFDDCGHIGDPLVGRRCPDPDRAGGRGLYLVNQLCDLVQLRSWADGTELRLTTWR